MLDRHDSNQIDRAFDIRYNLPHWLRIWVLIAFLFIALLSSIATTAQAPTASTDEPISSLNAAINRPASHLLSGFRWELQTWNNCGPASITIALSYFGWTDNQETAASYLKPDTEDKNVSPSEMVAFVNEATGVRAVTRMGGTLELLKSFVASGFPVVISTGYLLEGEDWLGHYRTIVGYDDIQQIFYVYDSLLGAGEDGAGLRLNYSEVDLYWQQFNRNFIVLFEQNDEPQIRSLLGNLADLSSAAEQALTAAQEEARTNPQNGFAWFNIGTSLVALNRYEEASRAYDQAFRLSLPWRMLWYQFSPYRAYYEVGRYSDVMALAMSNLNNGGEYVEETHYWQGQALLAQGNEAEAETAFRRALTHNSRYEAAQSEITKLSE